MKMRLVITKTTDGEEIARQIVPHMEALGQAIGARAQRLVPKRTYALHDTITAETKQFGGKVTTAVSAGGGDVDYALFVERGTSRMAAQPYLRPAFLQSRASDLNYSGGGIERHGVRRVRVRSRVARVARRDVGRREIGGES